MIQRKGCAGRQSVTLERVRPDNTDIYHHLDNGERHLALSIG